MIGGSNPNGYIVTDINYIRYVKPPFRSAIYLMWA